MKSDDQLQKDNPELYRIARQHGTEAPNSSDLLHIDVEGVFHCAVCGAPLFRSETKFDSGSGWPSFTDPVDKEAVILVHDTSHGMRRTEVRCKNCNSHLGHVFPDGPQIDHKHRHDRYCLNGISLELREK